MFQTLSMFQDSFVHGKVFQVHAQSWPVKTDVSLGNTITYQPEWIIHATLQAKDHISLARSVLLGSKIYLQVHGRQFSAY